MIFKTVCDRLHRWQLSKWECKWITSYASITNIQNEELIEVRVYIAYVCGKTYPAYIRNVTVHRLYTIKRARRRNARRSATAKSYFWSYPFTACLPSFRIFSATAAETFSVQTRPWTTRIDLDYCGQLWSERIDVKLGLSGDLETFSILHPCLWAVSVYRVFIYRTASPLWRLTVTVNLSAIQKLHVLANPRDVYFKVCDDGVLPHNTL